MNAAAVSGGGHGRRALLTGAAGFTGQYMAKALVQAGYQVYGTELPGHDGGARSTCSTGTPSPRWCNWYSLRSWCTSRRLLLWPIPMLN
jgi:alpha-beta hydrolase superfamily lysophospholipase